MRYPPVGKCIYCGATSYDDSAGRKLAEEHIIPLALSGDRILPEASCAQCAKITGQFEQLALRGALRAVRVHLDLDSRKGHPPKLPVFAHVGENEVKVDLPSNEYPTMLLICVPAQPPGLLTGKAYDSAQIAMQAWVRNLGVDIRTLQRRGIGKFSTPSLDTHSFFRMIAKIAHAYAVAELGVSGFKPLLLDIVLRESKNFFGVIGCSSNRPIGDTDGINEISFQLKKAADRIYVVVELRLLSIIGGPPFSIVAGETTG